MKYSFTFIKLNILLDKSLPLNSQSALIIIKRAMTSQGRDVADGGAAAMNIEAEGPILLSTTEVNRTFVFQQLRQTVEQLRGV